MDPLWIIVILILGAVVIAEVSRSSHLENLNDALREQNTVLRDMLAEGRDNGLGCGPILGLLMVLAALLFVAVELGMI